ncbi:MAG: homoserine kinase [Tatlockia sp.]|nr:homoserine kinase [Tatlockia sp.]
MKKIKESIQSIEAFAPATCANVAVGFDILGFSIGSVGDYVRLSKRLDRKVIVESVDSKDLIPLDNNKNTAAVVVQKFCQALDLKCGFTIQIKKGIPLCSGMGGSAASAVAALIACNAFLVSPLSKEELAYFALFGEEVASGTAHADNIIPCLFGGLTLIFQQNPIKIIELPIPDLYCLLMHPHLHVPTRTARDRLNKVLALTEHVKQSANLAAFIAALYEKDNSLLRLSLNDLIIEPQRAEFVPEFYQIKKAALKAGALGMSFSGSGPSMFAFTETKEASEKVAQAMQIPLQKNNISSDYWISKISKKGAHVVEEII